MCVRTKVCTHVCMYVYTQGCMFTGVDLCMYACMYVRMFVLYICTLCMYECMCVCM
jgi:hypothetical protein